MLVSAYSRRERIFPINPRDAAACQARRARQHDDRAPSPRLSVAKFWIPHGSARAPSHQHRVHGQRPSAPVMLNLAGVRVQCAESELLRHTRQLRSEWTRDEARGA
ncbi:unnamed protein product [Lampetra planeri]